MRFLFYFGWKEEGGIKRAVGIFFSVTVLVAEHLAVG